MRQPSETYKLQTSTGCLKAFNNEHIATYRGVFFVNITDDTYMRLSLGDRDFFLATIKISHPFVFRFTVLFNIVLSFSGLVTHIYFLLDVKYHFSPCMLTK